MLEASSSEEMFEKEQELVEIGSHSYNLKRGGEGGFDYVNQKLTIEQRKEISRIGGLTRHISKEEMSKRISEGRLKSPKRFNHLKNRPKKSYFEGHTHSNETKKKIGEKNSTHQKGSNNSQYGTMWITNGIESKKIKKDNLIPEGWKKGRTL